MHWPGPPSHEEPWEAQPWECNNVHYEFSKRGCVGTVESCHI